MSFEKYFRDELDYLRQLGRDAAIERPHLAAFLSEQGSDPDVERLLEGFAFLTGNLREKIRRPVPGVDTRPAEYAVAELFAASAQHDHRRIHAEQQCTHRSDVD